MECMLCKEPVTNPVCQDCLAQAVEQWLHEAAPQKVESLRAETEYIKGRDGVPCIRCKQLFEVCTYCYTKHIFNWLADGELQLEFLEFFNFDLYQLKPYAGGESL
jgi:hypothetical protein